MQPAIGVSAASYCHFAHFIKKDLILAHLSLPQDVQIMSHPLSVAGAQLLFIKTIFLSKLQVQSVWVEIIASSSLLLSVTVNMIDGSLCDAVIEMQCCCKSGKF